MLTVDYAKLDLRRGHTLLDLGCGAGRHSFEALKVGAKVVAADLDGPLLREVADLAAAMFYEDQVPQGAAFVALEADATRLPFPDASFDRVVVSEVLEHIPHDIAGMAEVHRILKPGGVAAVTVPRYWPERVCWALSTEYHSNEGGHVRIYKERELERKLSRCGFVPTDRHHAHAFHAPYWWLKCAVGVRREDALLPGLYRRFLEWQITSQPRSIDKLERALDPVLGKSLVVYAAKPVAATSRAGAFFRDGRQGAA